MLALEALRVVVVVVGDEELPLLCFNERIYVYKLVNLPWCCH